MKILHELADVCKYNTGRIAYGNALSFLRNTSPSLDQGQGIYAGLKLVLRFELCVGMSVDGTQW